MRAAFSLCACALLTVAACQAREAPAPPVRACLPASHLLQAPAQAILTEDAIIARAKSRARENYAETPRETGCCDLVWIDTSVDEPTGEWSGPSQRTHREARAIGLQRYAVVRMHVRDRFEAEHFRFSEFDQCGNPLP